MTENERVKELRKARGLTLEKFGERLGVGKSAISDIERGRNSVTDQMRRSICREFGVREEWLRGGEGAMEAERSVSDEIEGFLKDIKTDDRAFRARLVAVLARLSPEEWGLLEAMAVKLAEGVAAEKASTPEQRARSRANDFYEEALAEEKAADESSASPPTGAKEA